MELWRAPAGSGKTEAVLTLIAETVKEKPLTRVWVVLPSNRQRASFRVRLLEHLREANLAAFNVELFNFYSLNRRLLNLMRVPVRSLGRGARQAVLRRIAGNETLESFAPVANMPGFSSAVGQLIRELKHERIEPDAFAKAAISPEDRDIAQIYDTYQSLLQANALVDTEGEAWLALDTLLGMPEWDAKISLLAVDGFDQFTGVQAHMIRTLAKHAAQTVVTLTEVQGREDGIGRRFTSAENALGAAARKTIAVREHPQPAVRHLLENAFRISDAAAPMASDSAQNLRFIEAHSPSAEAAEVMRQIKRRLVIDKTSPDDIMVVVRDWARYQPALSSAADEYGVPLSLQAGSPLLRHPLTAALNAILTLPESDFTFGAVIDALRSPYIALEGMTPELLAKVEKAARKFNLYAGRDSWDAAMKAGAQETENYAGQPIAPILTHDEQRAASEALNQLFDSIPTPDYKERVWNLVWRIEELIGVDPEHEADLDAKLEFTLNIAEQVRKGQTVSHDLAALHAIKTALKELLLTEDLLSALAGDDGRILSWRDFLADFQAALTHTDLSVSPDRSGHVLVTTASDARGTGHKHVYILGLSEGIFPAPLTTNPLYLDSESVRLIHAGRQILRTAAERADDDSLFFELIAQAQESLTLSRPAMNGGQAWPPSALWKGVVEHIENADLQTHRTRIAPGRPPQPENAASLAELAAALQNQPGGIPRYRAYLDQYDAQRTAHILYAGEVESGRYMLAETGETPPHIAAHVADLRGHDFDGLPANLRRTNYRWSASSINALSASAYRVFAEKMLGLEALEDPAEGADAALEGSLIHQILEATYKDFQSPEHPIAPENLDEALALLGSAAAAVFDNAIKNREFIPSPIWEQQQQVIERYLQDLIKSDFSAESPVSALFGGGKRWTLLIEKKFGDDGTPPVIITADTGEGRVDFQLTGTIDRVDCIDDGETLRLVVIDYKRSGGTITPANVIEGQSTQIALYTTVLEGLLATPDLPEYRTWFSKYSGKPVEVAGGLFWSVRKGEVIHSQSASQSYRYKNALYSAQELKEMTLSGIAGRILNVRNGDFRPLPSNPQDGQCAAFCQLHEFCRVCEMLK